MEGWIGLDKRKREGDGLGYKERRDKRREGWIGLD